MEKIIIITLDNVFPVDQEKQNLNYFYKTDIPITLSNLYAQTLDPSSLPCDIGPTKYDVDGVYGENSMNAISQVQIPKTILKTCAIISIWFSKSTRTHIKLQKAKITCTRGQAPLLCGHKQLGHSERGGWVQ